MTHLRQTLMPIGHSLVGHLFVQAAVEKAPTERLDIGVSAGQPRAARDRVALTCFLQVGADESSLLPAGEYDDPRVRLVLDNAVTATDRDAQSPPPPGRSCPMTRWSWPRVRSPFVPPLPGRDLQGCFAYRTIEDLEAIRAAATARVGAVIGGGLLGLEAANALLQLGLQTHVVEMAPRPVAVQLDRAPGASLAGHIEGLEVTMQTGAGTEAIEGVDGKVTSLAIAADDDRDRPGRVRCRHPPPGRPGSPRCRRARRDPGRPGLPHLRRGRPFGPRTPVMTSELWKSPVGKPYTPGLLVAKDG
jgi:nitrite reductase (NADH) large subunit